MSSDDCLKLADVDECVINPCSGKCINTEGSYRCECEDGYTLRGDDCIGKIITLSQLNTGIDS